MPDSTDVVCGKNSGLLVHDAALGLMETPLTELRRHAITPKELVFTRQHDRLDGGPAWLRALDPPPAEVVSNWRLRIGGLVRQPFEVSVTELKQLPQEKRISVLQCSGNGRAFYSAKQKAEGDQWQRGAMANLAWEGVSLRKFIEAFDIRPAASAAWLTAEGWRAQAAGETAIYAKSCPLEHPALDHAILALTMNGEPIPAVHGGPLRLVIPGFYGNIYVKALATLDFAAEETRSEFQTLQYRMPKELPADPQTFGPNDYDRHNSVPSYAHAIKSVIFSPLAEDKVDAGEVEITGVAFNDGASPIARVDVSTDGGQSWRAADIKPAASRWAWHHWSLKTRLGPGRHELMSRATDANGESQPLDGQTRWNVRGYEWNGVDRVAISI